VSLRRDFEEKKKRKEAKNEGGSVWLPVAEEWQLALALGDTNKEFDSESLEAGVQCIAEHPLDR
jgi:hypothetical protein